MPIAVLGGGIGGLACAVALRQRGHACVVFEQAPELREIGAGLLLTYNACAVLERLGVRSSLDGRSVSTPAWQILDDRGRVLQRLRPFPAAERALSTRRSDLQSALRDALPEDAVRLDHEALAIDVSERCVELRFRNGHRVETPLLVAADGARSLARQTLWPGRRLRNQGYVGWRALVPGVPPGREDGRITESWGRGLRFGVAPVNGRQTYWYASANLRSAGMADPADPAGRREKLLRLYRGWHEPVCDLIADTRDEHILLHPIADTPPSWSWTRAGRLALLGDAAHPLTPNLGQGAAMALEDAWELARCVAEESHTADALRRYGRRRRVRVALVWALSRAVGMAIQWEDPRLTALRDATLRVTPDALASATLRRLFSHRLG